MVTETVFFLIVMKKSPNYLLKYVSTVHLCYQTRNSEKCSHMSCKTEYFANSYFPYTIKEWNNLSLEIPKSVSYEVFKNSLLTFTRPTPNSLGIKLLSHNVDS